MAAVFGVVLDFPAGGRLLGQEPVPLPHLWSTDPPLGADWVDRIQRRPLVVDVANLSSDVTQHRVSEAQRIAFHANRAGIENPQEALDAVLKQLPVPEENLHVSLAMVSAAVQLCESVEDIENVWQSVAERDRLHGAVESALMRWESAACADVWRRRIKDRSGSASALQRAVEGLGVVGTSEDVSLLTELLEAEATSLTHRIAAAKALGLLQNAGAETLAQRIRDTKLPNCDLIAALLLSRHESDEAGELLVDLVASREPAAVTSAYRALANNHRDAAFDLTDALMHSSDNQIRDLVIQVLNGRDDESSINRQAELLGDKNVHVRRAVRENLARKASEEQFRETVESIVAAKLANGETEAVEQAILLAVELKLHQHAPAFIDLLDHPQPEVYVRAAWGLQYLELTPEILSEVERRGDAMTESYKQSNLPGRAGSARDSYLLCTLGKNRVQSAEAMLRFYVPKNPGRPNGVVRAAGVYALGKLWEGKQNKSLAKQFIDRVQDEDPNDPEDFEVKFAATIALARMQSQDALSELQDVHDEHDALQAATNWAVEHLESSAPDQ